MIFTQSKNVMKTTVSFVFLLSLLLLPLSAYAINNSVEWTPERIEETLDFAGIVDIPVTFISSTELEDVDLRVVPNLQHLVNVEPNHFETIIANTTYHVTVHITVPHGTYPGLYDGTVHLVVGKRTYPQTLKVNVVVGMPDLVVSSLTVIPSLFYEIYYSYTITNVGTAPVIDAGNVIVVQAFISADTIFFNSGDIAAGGTILGSLLLGELAPGESFSRSSGADTLDFDPALKPYLILMVDWREVVNESDETNNTMATLIPIDVVNNPAPAAPTEFALYQSYGGQGVMEKKTTIFRNPLIFHRFPVR